MENEVKIVKYTGWHGTEESVAESVSNNNFQESKGSHHWLGEGVYFFTKGIGDPQKHAIDWVQFQAYEKKYTRYAILEAVACVNDDAVLDLRRQEALEFFNQHREFVLRQLRRGRRGAISPNIDGKIFEHLRTILDIQVVIKNMYVKLTKEDRIQKIDSRVENCTFLCVYNPKENIDTDTIRIVQKGNI